MVRPLPEEERPSLQAYFERNPGDPKTPLRLLDFFLEMPRLNRTRVALLDLPLEVDVDDDRVVALRVDDDQAPWHEPPGPIATGTIAPGRHRGRLVGIVMSTTSPWRLDCFVVIDGLVRGAWSSGQPKDDELAETVQQINYYEAFRKPTGMRPEAFLMQAISASRLSGQEAPDIAAHTDEATITVSMALREVLAEHGWGGLFSTIPTAADSGVRTLLTGPLVRALSATGLVNSYSNSRSEIAHQLASIGHDLDELIDACNRLASERAVRLLDTDAESVRARV